MRLAISCVFAFLLPPLISAQQPSLPLFRHTNGAGVYTLLGRSPAEGGTTHIRTALAPIRLSFAGNAVRLDPTADIAQFLLSPVFAPFPFGSGEEPTQYADAMLRATFPEARSWHTLLEQPNVLPAIDIKVPAAFGYLLHSAKFGGHLGIVDIQYLQLELFRQLPKLPGTLVFAITRNTTFYVDGDATICCSWGTHGTDKASGNSFLLASYLGGTPPVVTDSDVQAITQQLAEFINDPLHDPSIADPTPYAPGNRFPAWLRPASMQPGDQGPCGGTQVSSAYFLLEPTDTNGKNDVPASVPFVAHTAAGVYHLENVALLSWYLGSNSTLGHTYSFPNEQILTEAARPCSTHATMSRRHGIAEPDVRPLAREDMPIAHKLIGYWTGRGSNGTVFPLRNVAPQWDIVIVAFAAPDHSKAEGTLVFKLPQGVDPQQFKAAVSLLKSQGRKVMISLGGGGAYFSLKDRRQISNFVSCVSQIVSEYGFDGVDIDFETPSLVLDEGDGDYRHPTTPSVVNLIAALRELHERFGSQFMISLVPEGPQIPAGHMTYGGQFGSYLPLAYGLRDILSFMDVQDYNTPPIEGLDGEIYQSGSVDYHAAVTDLVLHGFSVGGESKQMFKPLPAEKIAVGFLVNYTSAGVVVDAMSYLITGRAPAGSAYKLQNPAGYSDLMGAMFWTIDDDRRNNYEFSNVVGPELHMYPLGSQRK